MNKKGFTLTELLAVVAILAILTIVALPNIVKMFNKSIEETMRIQENQVLDAANLFKNDNCGRNAMSSEAKEACSKLINGNKLNNKVYICLKTIQGKDNDFKDLNDSVVKVKEYVGNVYLKGNTLCDGLVMYDYDENLGSFSNGKTYLVCAEDSYQTPGYEQYRAHIEDCIGTAIPDEPEPEPEPTPESTSEAEPDENEIDEPAPSIPDVVPTPTTAYFKTGIEFNELVKTLVNGSNKEYTFVDNTIKGFVKESSLLSDITKINVSTDDSTPIYVWFSDNKLHYYSSLSDIRLNPNSSHMFYNMMNLTDISGLSSINISETVSMYKMFSNCSSLKNLSPLSSWEVNNVENFGYMFDISSGFISTYSKTGSIKNLSSLSNWNTSSATNMSHMFQDQDLEDLGNLSNWDFSNVNDFGSIFGMSASACNVHGPRSALKSKYGTSGYASGKIVIKNYPNKVKNIINNYINTTNDPISYTNVNRNKVVSYYSLSSVPRDITNEIVYYFGLGSCMK